eukprot:m.229999 g.229999  ORF g.229999 m.229999 type:complete len:510 (+) comp17887_c0_seq1:25-1554(+)
MATLSRSLAVLVRVEHAVAGLACALALVTYLRGGPKELRELVRTSLHNVPGFSGLSRKFFLWLYRNREGLRDQMLVFPKEEKMLLPEHGMSAREVEAELTRIMIEHGDAVSQPGDVAAQKRSPASSMQLVDGHASSAYLERAVVAMSASMLHGPGAVGMMTSGGTESIMMSLKAHRDWARARHPGQRRFEVVAPITVHPAFEKAAHLFDLIMVHVPVDAKMKVDVQAYRRAITADTVLLVVSAPQYCHGVVDPVAAVSELALEFDLPLHVDACFGGFMLPWVEKIGFHVPTFDFRLEGVSSISADLHKYGFSVKGSSVLLFRSPAIRKHAVFADAEWPGGLYAQTLLTGPRPEAIIAASWAALVSAGQVGFFNRATSAMETTVFLMRGIQAIDPLFIVGEPCMTAFAIASSSREVSILAVADNMEARGWKMERQQLPDCLHFSIMPHHTQSRDTLLADLKLAVEAVRGQSHLSAQGTAAIYGLVARIPDRAIVSEYLVEMMNTMYTVSS